MKSSPEPGRRAVVLDANVLSRLARIGRLDVIPQAFSGRCYLTSAIASEIEAGLEAGVMYLEVVRTFIQRGELCILSISEEDRHYMDSLPRKLGKGEAEGIALCRHLDMVFITHDRQAANFCNQAGVRCLHFRSLVEALQTRGLLTPDEARRTLE
jgi:predicted nucleic acid-binding protein